MSCAYIAFTETGLKLAERLALLHPGSVSRGGKNGVKLSDWTAENFQKSDALIFIGAVGIAVRAIAPHCKSKATDPAVIVLDERGRFSIPILSGHLGGANDLAKKLASICGAVPVITTATDVEGVFAVDEWAKAQNCHVLEPERIKTVSGTLLADKVVYYDSQWKITGTQPKNVFPADENHQADFSVTLHPQSDALHLVPKICVLGVGCKRGTSAEHIEATFKQFCKETGCAPQSICACASIDLKKEEPGLLEFCQNHDFNIHFYTAEELKKASGEFTSSSFVQQITGVDNVCARAAVLASGGELVIEKHIYSGVTFAVAAKPFTPDWSV